MRIIHENLALNALIYVSRGSEDVNYQLANAVSGQLSPETRLNAVSNQAVISFDFGFAQAVNGCLVRGHNLLDGQYIFVSGNASETDPWAVGDKETTLKQSDNYIYYFFDSPKSHQYWHVGKGGFTQSYMLFGEIWLFNNTELPHNCTMSSAVDQRTGEVSEIITGGGNIWSYPQWKGRIFNLTWELLTESELQAFIDLHGACYPNKTFWLDVGIDSTSPDLLFCYYRNKSLDITPQGPGLYSVNLEIQEVSEPVYYA